MVRSYVLTSLLLVSLLWLQIVAEDGNKEEEICQCILFGIKEDVRECADFENKGIEIDLKMKLEEGVENEPDSIALSGSLTLNIELAEGVEVCLTANQETELGNEPVFSCVADMCKSMEDTDAPWYPIWAYLNASACPIPTAFYPIEDLKFNVDFANGVLNSDFCGDYLIEFSLRQGIDTIMCMSMGAEIYQAEKPCSECPNNQNKK